MLMSTFYAGTGAETYRGSTGHDAVVFSGAAEDFQIRRNLGGAVEVTGLLGTTTLYQIEELVFDDASFYLTYGGGSAEFQVNNYVIGYQSHATVTELADGGWVIGWDSGGHVGYDYSVHAQIFSAAGDERGGEFQIGDYSFSNKPSFAALEDGGWVAVWQEAHFGGGGAYEIYGQRFDVDGNAVASKFHVNTYVPDWQMAPIVSALEGGGWVVAWKSDGQDGSSYGIYAQRYTADGLVDGEEFQVHSVTAGQQGEPVAAALAGVGGCRWR
jgi:hypothetical protein